LGRISSDFLPESLSQGQLGLIMSSLNWFYNFYHFNRSQKFWNWVESMTHRYCNPSKAKTCFITDPSIIIQDFFKFSFRISKVCILFLSQNPPTFLGINLLFRKIIRIIGRKTSTTWSVRRSKTRPIFNAQVITFWANLWSSNICERNEFSSQN